MGSDNLVRYHALVNCFNFGNSSDYRFLIDWITHNPFLSCWDLKKTTKIHGVYLLQKPTLPCPYFWRDTALCLCICRLMCVYVRVCGSGCRTRKSPFHAQLVKTFGESAWLEIGETAILILSVILVLTSCVVVNLVSWSTVPSSSLDF